MSLAEAADAKWWRLRIDNYYNVPDILGCETAMVLQPAVLTELDWALLLALQC